ncbi:hypothetical protein DER46DRAFT_579759 [Fusarium sp. MPI-SDFR-AT-0072]|nr:hypothetical protein DER46DRAFT_579759 [Fusarium sp. MPI-SDFR-AT-0072]
MTESNLEQEGATLYSSLVNDVARVVLELKRVYKSTLGPWQPYTQTTFRARKQTSSSSSTKNAGSKLSSRMLKVFIIQQEASLTNFVHIPTFDTLHTDTSLLMAFIAAGAARAPSPRARKFGLALMEVVRLQIEREIEVQFCCADRRRKDMASSLTGVLASMLRQTSRFNKETYRDEDFLLQSDSPHYLDAKWKRWVEAELWKRDRRLVVSQTLAVSYKMAMMNDHTSLALVIKDSVVVQSTLGISMRLMYIRRLVYQMVIHCSQDATFSNSVSLIFFAEVFTPIPAARNLWYATTAVEWRRYWRLALMQNTPFESQDAVTLYECIQMPAILEKVPTSQDKKLGFLAVLHCVANLAIESRRRQSALIGETLADALIADESTELACQDQQVERRMTHTQSLWEVEVTDLSIAAAVLIEFTSMRYNTPIDKIEAALFKDDPVTTLQAFHDLIR